MAWGPYSASTSSSAARQEADFSWKSSVLYWLETKHFPVIQQIKDEKSKEIWSGSNMQQQLELLFYSTDFHCFLKVFHKGMSE